MLRPKNHAGFSLIELAIVLIIVGIFVGGSLAFFGAMVSGAQERTVKERLKTLQVALQSHVERFGYLPCPASLTAMPTSAEFARAENCSDMNVPIGLCAKDGSYCVQAGRARKGLDLMDQKPSRVRIGGVPARAINVPFDMTFDVWGNKIIYAVTESMAQTAAHYQESEGAISIIDESGASVINPPGTADYVVYSQGRNGFGARSLYAQNAVVSCPPGQNLDDENCDYTRPDKIDAVFRAGFHSEGEGSGKYDDYLVFVANSVGRGNQQIACRERAVCTSENKELEQICQVRGGSDGLPLCTHRQDVTAGTDADNPYEHDITTWKHACDFGPGWQLPSMAELKILQDHHADIGGFAADQYYLTRSYYNPGLIENDDRKMKVWARRFTKDNAYGDEDSSNERLLNISPEDEDDGRTGRIRCIQR